MNEKTKKIVKGIVIIAAVGFTGYAIYRLVQSKKTKSGNPTKDNRKIKIVRA